MKLSGWHIVAILVVGVAVGFAFDIPTKWDAAVAVCDYVKGLF
jgi:hypothetical protein